MKLSLKKNKKKYFKPISFSHSSLFTKVRNRMKGLIITQILNNDGSEHFTSRGQAFFLKYSFSSHLSLSLRFVFIYSILF